MSALSAHRRTVIAHATVCLFLGCGFLWFAGRSLVSPGTPGPISPYHTTDKYFAGLLKTRLGSQRLMQVLGALPANEPVAVLFRAGEDEDIFLAYLVAYFAWPRVAQPVPLRGDDFLQQADALHAQPFSAIFFCGVKPPPALQQTVRIGDGLVLEVRSAKSEVVAP